MSARRLILLLAWLSVLAPLAQAAPVSWTGAGDGVLWSDFRNWSGNAVPPVGSDVTIGVVAGNPTIQITSAAGTVQVNSLTTSQPISLINATLKGGTITAQGGASLATGSNFSTSTLDGITLAANLTVVNSTNLQLLHGLTLSGGAKVTLASTGTGTNLYFQGTQTLGGSGEIFLGGTSSNNSLLAQGNNSQSSAATLTIGSGITVHGTQGGTVGRYYSFDNVIYQGAVTADAAGQTITVGGSNWSNTGTFTVSGTATLNLAGSLLLSNLGVLNRSGGTISLSGTLDLGGGTLALTAATGSWLFAGCTIKNGTITATGGASLASSGSFSTSTLDGITLASDLTMVNSTSLNVLHGLTLGGGAKVTLASTGTGTNLYFQGTQTLGGTGEIVFGGTSSNNSILAQGDSTQSGAANLTIGSGITVHGTQGGTVGRYYTPDNVLYQGAVTADTAGQTITVGGANWSNTGTFNVSGTATLNLAGSFLRSNLGVLNRSGGTVSLSGTLDLGAGTLALTATTGSWSLTGGTIKNGTITATGGASLASSGSFSTSALDGITLASDLTIVNSTSLNVLHSLTLSGGAKVTLASTGTGANLYFQGTQTLGGTGEIIFGGTSSNNSILAQGDSSQAGAATLTIGSGITIHGTQGGTIGRYYNPDNVVYQGTVTADAAGQTITISGANWSNTGTFSLSGTATLNLAGSFLWSSLGTLNRNGGTVTLSGTLDLAGGSLPLTAGTGSWLLTSGTIRNGTITATGGAALTISSSFSTSTLDGITLATDLTVANSTTFQVLHGLTLSGGAKVTLASTGTSTNLYFQGTQTLGGTGEIVFGGTASSNNVASQGDSSQAGAATLTIGSGITVHGTQGGTVGRYYTADNVRYQGAVTADAAGQTITVSGSNWSNTGTFSVSGMATLNLSGGFLVTNLGVLNRSGGTVSLSGTLDLGGGTLPLTAATGSWLLTGGTIKNGTVTATGGASLSSSGSFSTSTLDGVTLASDLTVVNSTSLNLLHGLTLSGGAKVTLASTGTSTNLYFLGTQTLGGTGEIIFGGTSSSNSIGAEGDSSQAGAATLTIGSGITVHGTQGGTVGRYYTYDNVVYQGTVTADAAGQTITVGGSNWSNTGTFNLSGTATLNFSGSFLRSNLGVLNRSGGTVSLSGTIDLGGGTLPLTAATGSWLVTGGTLRNGTVSATGGAGLASSGSFSTSTLDGVALTTNLTVANSTTCQVLHGLTLVNGAKITLASTGTSTNLYFQGTQTLGGTGEIVFGGSSSSNSVLAQGDNTQAGAATLTIGSSVTVHGTQGGTVGRYYSYDGIVNQGTVSADTSGQTISLTGAAFANQGTLSALNGGILSATSPLAINGAGLLNSTVNSSLLASGNLLGSTTAVTTSSPQGTTTFTGSGTSAAPQLLEAMSHDYGAVLAGFSQNMAFGKLTLTHNTYVKLVDQSPNTSPSGAEAVYASSVNVPTGCTLNLNGLHLYAHDVQVTGTVVNGSIMQVVDTTVSWTGAGDGFSWSDLQNWQGGLLPGAVSDVTIGVVPGNPTIQITGASGLIKIHSLATSQPINVSGGTLQVATTIQLSSNLILAGGTVNGGTIASGNGATMVLTGAGGTLNAVTIAAGVTLDGTVAGANASVTGGLTLNGTAALGLANGSTSGQLYFLGTQTLGGTGTVNFGGSSGNGLFERTGGSGTLTIGAGITIQGGSGTISGYGSTESILNAGTINIPAGQVLLIGGVNWVNNGVINAAGAVVTLGGTFNFAALGNFNVQGGSINLAGTLDNTGSTLTLNSTASSWNLAGGTIRGGTVVTGGPAFTAGSGALDGVTLGTDLTISGGLLVVKNGLTLNHVKLILERATVSFQGSQTLGGNGEVQLAGAAADNYVYATGDNTLAGAATLTLGSGITFHSIEGGGLGGFYRFDGIVNQGTVQSDTGGRILGLSGASFANQGTLAVVNLASLDILAPLSLDGSGVLTCSAASSIQFHANLTGGSTAVTASNPAGTTTFNGSGTQKLEAMSRDLGPVAAGFVQNFAYATLVVSNSTYVQLVDQYDNAGGSGPEAVYADSVTIGSGSTFDLNGLHLYTHTLSNFGTVVNGTISRIPNPVLTTVTVGITPSATAVNPVTNKTYVANSGDNSVTVIDGATGVTTSITVGTQPVALGINVTTNKIYVANGGEASVSVIDGLTNIVTRIPVGNSPQAIAVNPVTNTIYVANRADNFLSVISGDSVKQVAGVPTGSGPAAVAVNVVTNKVYVACFGSNLVTVIDGATNAATSVNAGMGSIAVAVNAATNKVYVANQTSGTVTVIDGATNAPSTLPAGQSPSAIVANPITNEVYVANKGDGTVTIINGATKARATIPVGTAPSAIGINSRTNSVYVANAGADSVTVLDGATGAATMLAVGSQPVALAVDPITNRVYVANSGSGGVSVLDGTTNRTGTLAVGTTPSAVAVNPVTNQIYTANFASNSVTISDPRSGAATSVATGKHPVALAINWLTNRLYVANADGASVTVIDGSSNLATNVPVGAGPNAIAVNLVTNRIYVTSGAGNSVSCIDGASNATTVIPAGTGAGAVAINPATNQVYVTNSGGNSLTIIDGNTNATSTVAVGSNPRAVGVNVVTNRIYVANQGDGNVTVIDGITLASQNIGLGTSSAGPAALAVNPLTDRIYVVNGGLGNGTVTVIEGTNHSSSVVTVGALPKAIAIDQRTNLIYVTNAGGNSVAVIDGATNATGNIPTGAMPVAVAVNPVTDQVFAANSADGTVSVISPSLAGANNLATSIDDLPGHTAGASTATLGVTARSLYGPSTPAIRQIWYQLDTAAGPWLAVSGAGASLGALQPGEHTLYAFATDGQESTSLNSPIPGQVTAYPFAATGGGTFSFVASTVTARSSDAAVTVTVQRDFRTPARVDFATVSGTAISGTNFVSTAGTLSFAQDEMTKTVRVPLSGQPLSGSMGYFTLQLANPGGSSMVGTPGSIGIFLLNDLSTDLSLSALDALSPGPAPAAGGSVAITLMPAAAGGQWRLFGELDWRNSGDTISGLTAATYQVEFKPVNSYQAPAAIGFSVVAGALSMGSATYVPTSAAATGSLTIALSPAMTGGWRLQGETSYRPGGATRSGLPAGTQIVEFQAVNGLVTPENREVIVTAGQLASLAETYLVGDSGQGETPDPVSDFTDGDPRLMPARSFTGQIQTDNGFGTGFVPVDRVVLTAAHVLFDDGSLSYVQGLRWFFQHETGSFETPPQIPRGAYLLAGYAGQRAADHSPGVSTPASQQLDAAAMYFLQPAARGGQSGFLASNSAANPWLTNSSGTVERDKFIAGYPVSVIDPANKGRLYATPTVPDAFTYVTGSLFNTTALSSYPGNSGGPLFVELTDSVFYPAAIYLGGTAQTVVRAIDSQVVDLLSRGEVSGKGGPDNVGPGVFRLDGGLTGTTRAAFGSLSVVLQPPSAVAAGARWGSPARASGEQDLSVSPGTYQINFLTVPGYTTPLPISVVVKAGQATVATANYIPLPPSITSSLTLTATVGQPVSFQVTASPAARSFGASPLPKGLILDHATGLLSGVPAVAGTFAITLSPTNDQGAGPASVLMLTVVEAGGLTVSVVGKGTITKGFATATVQSVGSTISLLATPAAGYLFDSWSSIDPNTHASRELWRYPSYTFEMPASLSLQAKFVPSPFPAVAGIYTGLMTGTADSPGLRGSIMLTASAQGSFTGTVLVMNQRYALKGAFDVRGAFAGSVAGGHGQPALIVNLHLDQSLSGLVGLGDASLTLQALRSPPGSRVRAAARYTMVLQHAPLGDGFGTVTVGADGSVQFTGKLGDGTPVSQSSRLGSNGEWAFYAPLYGSNGAITGQLTIAAAIGGTLEWLNNATVGGFHTSVQAQGALLQAKPLTGLTSASLTAAGGGLSQTLQINNVKIDPHGNGTSSGFALKIDPVTGLFTGKFTDSGAQAHSFSGVLLSPGGATPTGFGYFAGSGGATGSIEF